jgi:hypothetical protein
VGEDLVGRTTGILVATVFDAVAPGRLGPRARDVVVGTGTLALLALGTWAAARAWTRLESWLDRESGGGARPLLRRGLFLATQLAAAGLLTWIVRHPGPDLVQTSARFDHVAFALLAGLSLRRASEPLRLRALVVLSLGLVAQFVAWQALAGVLAACLAGFAATHWAPARRAGLAALVHGALVAGVFAWLWRIRGEWAISLAGVGLFVFVALRHVSFVVEACRGATSGVGIAGYVCFLLFYPTCIGAAEVFSEFREQNLRRPAPVDLRGAAASVVRGLVLTSIGANVPMDEGRMTASVGFAAIWTNLLLLYLRGVCFSMGIWAIAEASAALLGVRLRPNFRGVLSARNPAQFWRAWRGTMANWLIHHVYLPLGGGRQHRTRNIAAVFAVSTLWHCIGIPYLRLSSFGPSDLAPIALWGLLNFAGVAGHAWLRRARAGASAGRSALHPAEVAKWAATLLFGSLTVALLGFVTGYYERFGHVVRTLVGLGGW